MINRIHTPDKKLGPDGLPLTVLPEGCSLKNTYKVSFLSAGGMAIVYKAETRDKRYIIKEVDGNDSKAVIALNQEKATLERLEHPGIVEVKDLFEESGYFYLVLEYIEGENLLKKIPRSTTVFLSEKVVLDWAGQLMDIFEYLHRQTPPIIYRDLKPHNVILDMAGKIRLIDFGIARVYKKDKEEDTRLMGSAITASPEHYGEGQTDIRSDIYTIGATLFFLLTNNMAKREEIFRYPSIRTVNSKISERTDRVVAKALEMKPEDRFQTIAEMREALLGSQKTDIKGGLPVLPHTRPPQEPSPERKRIELPPSTRPKPASTAIPRDLSLICPGCGKTNQDDSFFCEFCGTQLRDMAAAEADVSGETRGESPGEIPEKIPEKAPGKATEQPPAEIPGAGKKAGAPEVTTPLPFSRGTKKKKRKTFVSTVKKTPRAFPVKMAIGIAAALLVLFMIAGRVMKHPSGRHKPPTTIALTSPSVATHPPSLPPARPSATVISPDITPSSADSTSAPSPTPEKSAASPPPTPGSPSPAAGSPSAQPSLREDPAITALMKEALGYMQQEHYNNAEEKLNEITKLNPGYAEAYWYLGQCLEHGSEKDEALKTYRKYIKKMPSDPERLRHIAGLLKESGDHKTAIKLETAALKKKETADGLYSLGYSYFQLKDYDNAHKYLLLAAKRNRNNYACHILLAQASIKSGNKGDALNAYKRASELEPDKTSILYQIALLASETGDYKTAKECLIRFVYQEDDLEARMAGQKLLDRVKIAAMKKIPASVERQTDFLPGVQVMGIMKYGESRSAHLIINGSQEEIREGSIVLDKYHVISIRESHVVLGDPETETYIVLRPM